MEGIMVSAATEVMNSLLAKLTTLLSEEYKLHKKVKRDVTALELELRSMNGFLENLAQKEDKEPLDPQAKEWRDQVRELAYDIEDFIDGYMYGLTLSQAGGTGIKSFVREKVTKLRKLGAAHGISAQIAQLKLRITEANERRQRYGSDAAAVSAGGATATSVMLDPPVHALYEEAENLVGIDGPREELIKLVKEGDMLLKVVSIVGPGGSGKTTLANQVYQKLGSDFQHRALVSVSRTPDMAKILRDIHLQVRENELHDINSWDEPRLIEEHRRLHGCTLSEPGIPDRAKILRDLSEMKKKEFVDINSWDVQRLIEELRELLKDKRYFVVIDDIWDEQAWRTIRCALPANSNCGSRIMTTTRKNSVAQSCCDNSHDYVHKISSLNKADSERLFFKRTFTSGEVCPPQLKDVSIEIVRRCAGLPLAIITMASLLSNRL